MIFTAGETKVIYFSIFSFRFVCSVVICVSLNLSYQFLWKNRSSVAIIAYRASVIGLGLCKSATCIWANVLSHFDWRNSAINSKSNSALVLVGCNLDWRSRSHTAKMVDDNKRQVNGKQKMIKFDLDDDNNEYESKWLWPYPVTGEL